MPGNHIVLTLETMDPHASASTAVEDRHSSYDKYDDRRGRSNDYYNSSSSYQDRRHNDYHRSDRHYDDDRYNDRRRRRPYSPPRRRQGRPVIRGTEEERATTTCLYVGNLPYEFGEKDVSDLVERYGKLVNVKVPQDRYTGRNKGFAFVEFEDRLDAEDALAKLHDFTVDGRRIKLDWDVGQSKKEEVKEERYSRNDVSRRERDGYSRDDRAPRDRSPRNRSRERSGRDRSRDRSPRDRSRERSPRDRSRERSPMRD